MEPSSPFEQYFDSDYPPTPTEILNINRLIDDCQAIVIDIDARIAELEEQRRKHTKFIARHRNLTTLVRGVPTDILLAIFLALHTMSIKRSTPHPSVAISHVCHQWRRLALATPSLWTRINISTPTPAPHEELTCEQWLKHVRSSFDRAMTFIRRAGTHPLQFAMVFQDPFDNATSQQVMPLEGTEYDVIGLIEQTLPVSADGDESSLESVRLSLKINPAMPVSLLYIPILDNLKMSGRLEVGIDYIKPGPILGILWGAMDNKISLRSTASTSLTLRMQLADLHRADADWDTLTDLTLGPSAGDLPYLYAEDVMPIIKKTVNLLQLSLEFRYPVQVELGPASSHQLANLSRLRTLRIKGNFIPIQFVEYLILPSLTNLSVTSHDCAQERSKYRSVLLAFLKECGHQLTDLTYDCDDFDQEVLSCALGLLPKVEVLQLASSHRPITQWGASAILKSLLRTPTPTHEQMGPGLVPKLRRLICELDEASSDVRNGVLGFIQARRSGGREESPVRWLEEVDVRFNKGSVDGMVEELRNRGVKTTLIQFRSLGRR